MTGEELRRRLAALPKWRYEEASEALVRRYHLPSRTAVLALVQLVGEISQVVEREAVISMRGHELKVTIEGGEEGLDERELSLARLLDDLG